MPHNPGTNYVEVNVYQAFQQMIAALNCGRMISVLPKCAFPSLALIELLAGSSGNQSNGIRDNITTLVINNKKMI